MTLLERFRAHVAKLGLPPGPVLVAVSGGPDSVALLDLLVRTRETHGLELIVAHLDHGIHGESSRVAAQVRSLAESYQLAFELGSLSLGPETGETLAREQRYRWLESAASRLGAHLVLTAHHADDQAETVLMRVLAGSGPAGLAGMSARQGKVVRPLLPFRRAELEAYVSQAGLDSWLDPANSDSRHLRSWLRTVLLPKVRDRVPQVDENLRRVSSQAARDRTAWDGVLDELPGLDVRLEGDGISVAAQDLADYDSALAQAILLALARRVGCRLGPGRLGRVFALLESNTSGARVPLGAHWIAELAFGRLGIYPSAPASPARSWSIQGDEGEGEWGRWRFRWHLDRAPEHQVRTGLSAWFTIEPMTVRGWSPGERVKPLGGSGHRLVVRCFQDVRVPRSQRGCWPVLAQNDDVVWIPGVCRSDALVPDRGTEALRIDAEYA